MKRAVGLFLCLVTVTLLLCSCGKQGSDPPPLPEAFSAKATVLLGEERYKGSYTRLSDSVCSFEVSEPGEISGMKLVINNGLLSLSFEGLAVDAEISQDVLPDRFSALILSELLTLRQVTAVAEKSKDGEYIRHYTASFGETAIYQSEQTGFLRGLECKSIGLKVTFEDAALVSKVAC